MDNFTIKRDIVVTTLKAHLLTGAIFGKAEIVKDEVRVPVRITKKGIMFTLKKFAISQGNSLTSEELEDFEKTLKNEYRATGIGFIPEK